MIYPDAASWHDAAHKRVMLFGMSGLGKTRLSSLLRHGGGWYHYSVDYRLGTRYLGPAIADDLRIRARAEPLLRDLMRADAVHLAPKIGFENLTAISTWLGKPGDPARGGLPFPEYRARQNQHRAAEIAAMHDSAEFAARAHDVYGYDHFICDTSGSVCEIIDPNDPDDPVRRAACALMLPVWICGDADHRSALVARFDRAPKPMYYNPAFLESAWADYTASHPGEVDPDAFIRWAFARALDLRQPRYAALAEYGVTVMADEVAAVATPHDFTDLIAVALDRSAQKRAG